MLPRNVLYYGTDTTLPEPQPLRAGPLSILYLDGDLRYIRLGRREIIRRIYVAVRDRQWGTIPTTLSNVDMMIGEDAFLIIYDAQNREGDIDFVWHGVIMGEPDGTITYSMEGSARSTFWRNRLGLCILHPIEECMGAPCRIEHVDGIVEEFVFPVHIAPQPTVDGRPRPHHPFVDMRALLYPVAGELWAEVRMEGDLFELEDQRNWTDASYKTYSTPLRLPYPVEVAQGTEIKQSMTLTLQGPVPDTDALEEAPTVRISLSTEHTLPLPRIGLSLASHNQPPSIRQIERLRTLNLSHLRVELRLSDPSYPDVLQRAMTEAQALDVLLECVVLVGDDAEPALQALVQMVETQRPPVRSWLILDASGHATSQHLMGLARQYLSAYDPTVRFGGGVSGSFTDLNREHPDVQLFDYVAFSVNPQVHASDNFSLVENYQSAIWIAESARQFVGDKPLAISPITLKPRPQAPTLVPDGLKQLPPHVDPRQMSLLGAGWTLGSLKYLAESGQIEYLTYYETTGWLGVMETESGSPLPEHFRAVPGGVFPIYHLLAYVGDMAGGELIVSRSDDPLRVEALVMRKSNLTRILLANLVNKPQAVVIKCPPGKTHIRVLDETSAEAAMRSPEHFRQQRGQHLDLAANIPRLALRPYGLTCLDFFA